MPVVVGAEEEKPFTGHTCELEKNDTIYLFTDGYTDQFGGTKNKKFKIQPFRNLIADIHKLSMDDQKSRIIETFDTWKGNLRQLDDVLVLGFRFSDFTS
jgi:serine phosphatase RsbU (regulator of sigma subunit)